VSTHKEEKKSEKNGFLIFKKIQVERPETGEFNIGKE